MIARISGILLEQKDKELVVDIGGIGYAVYTPSCSLKIDNIFQVIVCRI
jgi:Holliday junction resolvasome RuvABC DNA-binding subunit